MRMGSKEEQGAVLSLAKNLKNSEEPMSKVFVNRDISREERERDNKLRAKVAEERSNEEMRRKIRRGTLDSEDRHWEGVRSLE